MRIGEVVKACGLSAKVIRQCEEAGLIPRPPRGANHYRRYAEADVEILRFIAAARDVGLSAKRIGELVSLWRLRGRSGTEVRALALEHAAALRDSAAALDAIICALLELAEACEAGERPAYPSVRLNGAR